MEDHGCWLLDYMYMYTYNMQHTVLQCLKGSGVEDSHKEGKDSPPPWPLALGPMYGDVHALGLKGAMSL